MDVITSVFLTYHLAMELFLLVLCLCHRSASTWFPFLDTSNYGELYSLLALPLRLKKVLTWLLASAGCCVYWTDLDSLITSHEWASPDVVSLTQWPHPPPELQFPLHLQCQMTILALGDKIVYHTFSVTNQQRCFRVSYEYLQTDKVFWSAIEFSWSLKAEQGTVEGFRKFKVRFVRNLENYVCPIGFHGLVTSSKTELFNF